MTSPRITRSYEKASSGSSGKRVTYSPARRASCGFVPAMMNLALILGSRLRIARR
ncbi:MAG: hypothetical protein ACYTKD_26775 [Planctomycetota bacterium]